MKLLTAWLISLVAVCLLHSPSFADPPAADLQVVVNSSVTTEQLQVSQLRRIFSLRQPNWPDGQVLRVFVLAPENKVHERFCITRLQMLPYQLERLWNTLIYSGLGDPPTKVTSMAEMLTRIAATPGAIGYASQAGDVDNVSVITIHEG